MPTVDLLSCLDVLMPVVEMMDRLWLAILPRSWLPVDEAENEEICVEYLEYMVVD